MNTPSGQFDTLRTILFSLLTLFLTTWVIFSLLAIAAGILTIWR
jgi:hypothetical protein